MTNDKFQKSVLLKDLTTFHIGGLAEYYVEVGTKELLVEAVDFAKRKSLPIFILGGGSNILVSDKGFKGLVIKLENKNIIFETKKDHVLVTADAGVVWDSLVKKAVGRNLQGIECLSGIPGTVGAAPVQNIGAYGQEFKDTFTELLAYDLKNKKLKKLSKKECKFGYRDSFFKKTENKERYIVWQVSLMLYKNKRPLISYNSLKDYLRAKKLADPTVAEVRKAVLALRRKRLEDPGKVGNAGSFFKNPIIEKSSFRKIKDEYPDMPFFEMDGKWVKVFTGWLIEKADWKGKRYKNVGVSEKNALVLINPDGKGSASEIKELSVLIQKQVKEKFGIMLEPEVQFVGF